MSQPELFLLSPYQMPGQNSLSLADDEAGAFLGGYSALWHPALLQGAAGPPKVASPYDHEQPVAGAVYAVPESPPLILPDDWDQRVRDAGALAFRSVADREITLGNLRDALQTCRGEQAQRLMELPRAQVAPFLAIGFGYLMVDTLFEAMEHENLLATADIWQEVQAAVAALGGPDETVREHLQKAAEHLQSGREVLYPVSVYLIDLCLLDEDRLDWPLPLAFDKGSPLNLIASASLLEKLGHAHPERLADLRERVRDESAEVCSGPYQEGEDALLPLESQLWNLLKGLKVYQKELGTECRVFARKRFGAHPHTPLLLNSVGLNRAVLLPLDASVVPNFRATVTSWPSPDGKQVDTFTRAPFAAESPQTYFNLAHHLMKTIRQDQAATFALLHKDQPAAPWYEDWLELNRFGPVLGQWMTMSRYFTDAMAGEYASAANADDFHSDYLEERTNAHSPQPVSWFARHLRQRRRLDTVWTLAAFYRGLAGKNDQLGVVQRLEEVEDRFETGNDAGDALLEVQDQVSEALAARLLSRAAADQLGFLVLNPCGFARRLALELEGITGHLPVEGPVKACQLDEGKARLVVEVPPLGFAWFPRSGPPGTPPMKGRVLADKNGLRNEFFEAEVDPATGGLRAIRDHRLRVNRLGQQLVFNPGSTMRVGEIKVTSAGPALGEIISTGAILDEQQQVLATFRQRFRAWLGRPLLDLRIEIHPERPPTGYPWHSYYGARFAWRDERAMLLRGVNGTGYITSHTRPETPDYLEMRAGRQNVVLFPGGLPFIQRNGTRMLDVILLPEGETARTFDLAIGLDREHPMQTALGLATPSPVVPTAKGPPHVGASGWLYHLDLPNLLLTGIRPAPDGADGMVLRMMETSVHGGSAEFRCVRNPSRAALVDAKGETLLEAAVNGDAALFDVAACDLVQLRVDFS